MSQSKIVFICPYDTDADGTCGQMSCPWCNPSIQKRLERVERMSVLGRLNNELINQDVRWGEQNHPDFHPRLWQPDWDAKIVQRQRAHNLGVPQADEAKGQCEQQAASGDINWAVILTEEFCESIGADDDGLDEELIQTAAVAIQWVQARARRRRHLSDIEDAKKQGRYREPA